MRKVKAKPPLWASSLKASQHPGRSSCGVLSYEPWAWNMRSAAVRLTAALPSSCIQKASKWKEQNIPSKTGLKASSDVTWGSIGWGWTPRVWRWKISGGAELERSDLNRSLWPPPHLYSRLPSKNVCTTLFGFLPLSVFSCRNSWVSKFYLFNRLDLFHWNNLVIAFDRHRFLTYHFLPLYRPKVNHAQAELKTKKTEVTTMDGGYRRIQTLWLYLNYQDTVCVVCGNR